MLAFTHLFKLSYYFDSYPTATFPGFWVILGLTAVVMVASLALKARSANWSYTKREIMGRITGPLFVTSWIFLIWLFFRYQGIVYLTWRLWPLVLFVYLVVSAVRLVIFIKSDLPKKRENRDPGAAVKQHYLRRFAGGKRAGGSKKK